MSNPLWWFLRRFVFINVFNRVSKFDWSCPYCRGNLNEYNKLKRRKSMKLSQGTVIFDEDPLTEAIRREVRSFIERIVLEELAATLGRGSLSEDR